MSSKAKNKAAFAKLEGKERGDGFFSFSSSLNLLTTVKRVGNLHHRGHTSSRLPARKVRHRSLTWGGGGGGGKTHEKLVTFGGRGKKKTQQQQKRSKQTTVGMCRKRTAGEYKQ